MDLEDVIKNCKEKEVYKVTFAIDEYWYITKSTDFIWYCDENGEIFQDMPAVPLTYSNLRAEYELIWKSKP